MYKHDNYELMKNGEGYPDPTAYKGIIRADKRRELERERHSKLIGCLFRICELAGYQIEGRIVVRDLRTGKVWR